MAIIEKTGLSGSISKKTLVSFLETGVFATVSGRGVLVNDETVKLVVHLSKKDGGAIWSQKVVLGWLERAIKHQAKQGQKVLLDSPYL